MKGLASCLTGGFSGMPAHLGAMHAWHSSNLPPPEYICASSAGGIVGAITAQWDETHFRRAGDLMLKLRKKDFASLNPQIRNQGILTILSTLAMLIPTQEIEKLFPNNPRTGRMIRYLSTAGVTGVALWAQKKFVKDMLFKSESFLVYDNLEKLLLKTLDFNKIFGSEIKLELLAVNINKAGWMLDDILKDPPLYLTGWKNQGWVSGTNFRPEDTDLDKDARNLKLIEAIVNGTRIWSIFQAGRTKDGDFIVDTAALSNVPVHFAIKEGYDKVIVFYYNRKIEAPTSKRFASLLEITSRSNDITVGENSRKTILGYYRINNDLNELAKQRENLKKLEELVGKLDLDTSSQIRLKCCITEQEESLRKLSYCNKKRIKFLIIKSEPLAPINFSNFDGESMRESINKGAKALQDAVPEIEKLYKDES